MRKRKLLAGIWAMLLVPVLCVTGYAREMLIPVGRVVGLSLEEGSVTVAAFDDLLGMSARDAGIQIGDEILTVDGITIDSADDLQTALSQCGDTVELTLSRRGQELTVKLCPTATSDGPKLGLLIREGVSGIGTVTWYDPETDSFGALGHGVSDSRGALCDMRSGSVYAATVSGVRIGQVGAPGQLKGAVEDGDPIAVLEQNTPYGVFGTGTRWTGQALPVAEPEEVRTGSAQILSNIAGDQVETFSVEILRICDPDTANGRDMVIHVTDPELIAQTGGIVAGMSGSPIIQNGKLVGAVTHVLVNDPTRGYGILIENMLDAAE